MLNFRSVRNLTLPAYDAKGMKMGKGDEMSHRKKAAAQAVLLIVGIAMLCFGAGGGGGGAEQSDQIMSGVCGAIG